MKICRICKIKIDETNLCIDRKKIDGIGLYCKKCKSKKTKESYERNKIEINKRRAEKRRENPQKVKAWWQDWRVKNKDKEKDRHTKRRLLYPEKVKEEAARSQKKNKDHRNDYKRKWRNANKERIKDNMPSEQRLSLCISGSIRDCLYGNKNGRKWETLVGFSLKQLKKHLKRQFKPGMSWENYGKNGWHIDHIIPISVFNFKVPEDRDFKRCWALKNLQPLWSEDNLKKSNKLEKHFQPSLAF